MKPEFPDYPYTFVEGRDGKLSDRVLPCEMLRAGISCGNDATWFFVFAASDGPPQFVMVCPFCLESLPLSGAETTAYWRTQQREWGVRR